MSSASDLPQANFRISEAAKRGIEWLRAHQEKITGVTPGVVFVAWGIRNANGSEQQQSVIVGFYDKSQDDEVKDGIQIVDGVPLIFFTNERYVARFEGKVLDFKGKKFFLA